MNLYDFVTEENNHIKSFLLYWEEMHMLNPEEFPLYFDEEDSGLWWEALSNYETDDEVYKIGE